MLTRRRAHPSQRLVSCLAAAVLVGPLMLLASVPAKAVVGARPPGGSYEALTSARITDTRTGLGGVHNGPTKSLVVSTARRGGVPASGVSAVAVNIMIRSGSVGGFVTAYPTGSPRPHTSNVNFAPGQTVAQMAVVAVNGAGQFTIEASAPAHFVVDVEGYFTTPDTASTRGLFNPVNPARILDFRNRSGAGSLGPGGIALLQVTGHAGVPAKGVSAVVINTTVTGPTSTGYVTDYPTGSTRPAMPTLIFAPGQTVANRAIVPVGAGGTISIYNGSGITRPVIDITGYFTDGVTRSTGGYFVPVPSSRLVDTRYWQTTSYLSTRTLKNQKIAGQRCVLSPARTLCGRALVPPVTAPQRPIAALLNITAVPRDGSGYLTAFPAGSPTPPSSDVSFAGTTDASNIAFVGLGSLGEVSVLSSGGLAEVVEDLSGYFVLPAATLPPARVTAGALERKKGFGNRLPSRNAVAPARAPGSLTASGPTPKVSLKAVAGASAPQAQLTGQGPGGSSTTTQLLASPLPGTAVPVTAPPQPSPPVTALPQKAQVTAPSQLAPSRSNLWQTPSPLTAISQLAPPVTTRSQAVPSLTPRLVPVARSSWFGAPGQTRGDKRHHDDGSRPDGGSMRAHESRIR
jgi:hypothetical protein